MEIETMKKLKERFALRKSIFKEFLAEFLGTFVLLLFGRGSAAQTVLSRGAVGETLTVHIGFSLGLMMAVYLAGGVRLPRLERYGGEPGVCRHFLSQCSMIFLILPSSAPIYHHAAHRAHVNPAVSLAMVVLGKLKLVKFPVYVAAQFLGAFAGAAVIFGLYYDSFMNYASGNLAVTGINATAHIFTSFPAKHLSALNGFIDQVIGAGSLVLCILAITDRKNIGAPRGMEPLAVGLVVMAIAVSMALNCGYPINPARDLGPPLFTAVAGWGSDVFSAGNSWWWIPVAGPLVGGVLGALVYLLFIELHHSEPQRQRQGNDDSIKDKYEIITMS